MIFLLSNPKIGRSTVSSAGLDQGQERFLIPGLHREPRMGRDVDVDDWFDGEESARKYETSQVHEIATSDE